MGLEAASPASVIHEPYITQFEKLNEREVGEYDEERGLGKGLDAR